jgi:hypothetical protein
MLEREKRERAENIDNSVKCISRIRERYLILNEPSREVKAGSRPSGRPQTRRLPLTTRCLPTISETLVRILQNFITAQLHYSVHSRVSMDEMVCRITAQNVQSSYAVGASKYLAEESFGRLSDPGAVSDNDSPSNHSVA